MKNFALGFSLIELLIVMAILGVFAVFVANRLPSSRDKANDTIIRNDLSQYQNSLEVYANTNSGTYPIGGNTIFEICTSLRTSACQDGKARNYNYRVSSSANSYYIWAELNTNSIEGSLNYYVVCSNGQKGETVYQPSTDACPL